MYTFNSRIRYSETDERGALSLLGVVNYMQDCSTFQSEDARVGLNYLGENKKAWLLASWQLCIQRYPKLGEHIAVSTWPNRVKGIYGYRNFQIKDEAENSLVKAASVWFLYDTEKEVPVRVMPEDIAPYGREEPPLLMPPAPRRVLIPDTYMTGSPILVAGHHIDTNHHVNNAMYVEMAREALPGELLVEELQIDYKKAARLGDVLIPRITGNEDGSWTVILAGESGEACAAVWLKGTRKGSKL